MALNSVYGRVTNSMISGSLLRATNSTINNMFTTQEQISTGRRLLSTSMDPLGAAEFLRYSQRSESNNTYMDTVSSLSTSYNFVDSQVGEAVDVVNQLRQIALRESNDGAADADTRSLSVTEVNNLQTALMSIANAELGGQSLFAGSNTTEDAFGVFGDALRFNGDYDVNQRYIEDDLAFNTSLTADQVFGDLNTVSAARNDLNVGLNLATVSPVGSAQVSTPLSSLNGGRGVDLGEVTIVVYPDINAAPGGGVRYTADFSRAKTIADVAEVFNNLKGADGNPIFDADVYEGFSTAFPQEGMTGTSGLKLTAIGEVAAGSNGLPAGIEFQDTIGRTTARDLGLVTGSMDYQFTSRELPAGPYAGPLSFDLNVNGQNMPITVNPAGPMGTDELATALQDEITFALRAQGMFDYTVGVNGVDADGDTINDSLSFDISDASGTASFELVGTNPASLPLADSIQHGTLTGSPSFTQNPASFSNGVFAGRDLNPALNVTTGIHALNGGEGFQLEVDAAGNPLAPQGLRITNGALSADIDLAGVLSNPNATVGDLINRINGAGVQVTARISETGDRIEIASDLVGVPMTVENINGSIATQMGVDSRFSEMRVADLNEGRGIGMNDGVDFTATATNGSEVSFDFGEANTVAGIVNSINSNVANVQPNGDVLFEAKAVTERNFSTGNLAAQLAGPGVSPVFQISLDGSAARTIDLGGPHTSMDTLATAFESEINRVANQLGMDGFRASVNANNVTGRIDFTLQDSDGPAEIDFTSGFTTAFELDGVNDGAGVSMMHNESVSNRFIITDNSFDPAAFVPGGPQPFFQNVGGSTALEDLGLTQSDALRVQTIGNITTADPTLARTFMLDLPRGQQITVNVGAQAARNMETFAADFDTALRAAVAAAGIEGFATSVRIDQSSGGLMIESTDAYNNASVTVSGADAAAFGIDAANASVSSPSNVVFNVGNGMYEGKNHTLHGRAADNIFTSMNDLKTGLSANSATSIASTLGSLERAINLMLDARGEAGSRVRRLDLAGRRLDDENQRLAELSEGVMGIDLAEAATRLAQQENLFQAGIQATAKIARISLLDFI